MRIFTQSICFLTTDDYRPSVVSFLACLRYIFNSSVIPEILSNVEEDQLFRALVTYCKRESSWYRFFVRSHTMQFSSTLSFPRHDYISSSSVSSDIDDDTDKNPPRGFVEEIVLPLKKNMRYFSCTLQRCEVRNCSLRGDKNRLLAILADVRSLIHLECHYCQININDFLSSFLASSSRNQLEFLSIHEYGACPRKADDLPQEIEDRSFQRLRHISLSGVHYTCAVKLLRHCPNNQYLDFSGEWEELQDVATYCPKLSSVNFFATDYDTRRLREVTASLPLLTSLDLPRCEMVRDAYLENFDFLDVPYLANQLRALKLDMQSFLRYHMGGGVVRETFDFSLIGRLQNLSVLHLSYFDKDLTDKDTHYFANLLSLRDLDIEKSKITSNGLVEITKNASSPGSFLPQLVSLTLNGCKLGGTAESPQNLITFFSFCSSSLKKLSLCGTNITNDDLSAELVAHWKSIELLELRENKKLDDNNKESGLANLKQLTSLTELDISHLDKATHLDFISSMQKLRELNASFMDNLKPAAFAVFSQAPDSFLHLRTLNFECSCKTQQSGSVDTIVELLLKNDNIKYRLKWLKLDGVPAPKGYKIPKEKFGSLGVCLV